MEKDLDLGVCSEGLHPNSACSAWEFHRALPCLRAGFFSFRAFAADISCDLLRAHARAVEEE